MQYIYIYDLHAYIICKYVHIIILYLFYACVRTYWENISTSFWIIFTSGRSLQIWFSTEFSRANIAWNWHRNWGGHGPLDPSDPNNPRCVGYDGRCIPIPGIYNFIAPLMVHTWGRFTALWINIIKHPCMFLKEFDLRQLSVQQKVMWWQS